MKSIEDKLNRRIAEQKLLCAIDAALLEYYAGQKEALKRAEAGQLNKDKEKGAQAFQNQDPQLRSKEPYAILP